jgi:hypothetical protein
MHSHFWRRLMSTLLTLSVAACGSKAAKSTPTFSVEAIFTAAYQTFTAKQATDLALTPPTYTPAPTPRPTLPRPSPLPSISFLPTGPFSTPTLSTGGQSACDDAEYIADVTVPDGTKFDPGKKFVKTWLLQNTGSCAWNSSYKLSFSSGEQMGGHDVFLPLTSVDVGKQVQMSVNLVAPDSAGDYFGKWQMENDKGKSFGSFLTVVIKVGTTAPEDTPTP